MDEDWEEWDGRHPFWIHCLAGSVAGVVEHTAVYPLDTVRTHIQVCASCAVRRNQPNTATVSSLFQSTTRNRSGLAAKVAANALRSTATTTSTPPPLQPALPTGMWQTIRYLVNQPTVATAAWNSTTTTAATTTATASSTEFANTNAPLALFRLWRGVQTILVGCVPAHALYFSSYEFVKAATRDADGQVTTWGSSLAGAAATTSHDLIMTPLDTLKQRLQLGHYERGMMQGLTHILATEGPAALVRSFPITLATNIPYGMVMVGTHEYAKEHLFAELPSSWQTILASSSIAGFAAAAITTPLDRIKTALQTQTLAPACLYLQQPPPAGSTPGPTTCPAAVRPVYTTWRDAAGYILRHEGPAGFFRGVAPRILSHVPAVAISWTTYETAKAYLLRHYHNQHHHATV
jgi:solute carrier family 25 iron transporter 28/37